MNYTHEFLTIAVIHLLAVASPGPDFAVILRESVARGRRAGLFTSIGIGLGIFVHISYCIFGLGVVISQSILVFNIVKCIGAAYLIFIGFSAIRAQKRALPESAPKNPPGFETITPFRSLRLGFLTNALNPKATLFFLSVFSVVVNPVTPWFIQIGYGVWMAAVTALWFSSLTLLFSHRVVRSFLGEFGHWFDRVMGVLLIGLGIKLALAHGKS